MPKKYDRIFAQLFNTPWLITEDWMLTIIEIANREGDIEAVQAKLANPLINTEVATVRDGVAIIPISGPIFPKANLMTMISGATSVETVARDLTAAVENEEVTSIILNVDSPGGHVTGINELANMIRSYSGIKPIHGYSGGTAASAGYWLLSACSDVTIDATARLGSVGVVVALPAKKDEEKIEIVNTASPNKRVDYSSKEGKAVVVEELDALADVFISSVANFRNVSSSTVIKDFNKGGILVGADAVKAGMADRIGSFEELLKEKTKGGNSMPKTYSAASLQSEHPDIYEEIYNAGASAAVKESDEIIAGKDAEIATLVTVNAQLTDSNKEMIDKISDLQKKEAIREEQTITSVAASIVTDRLAASSVPARLHGKVKTLISHDKFVMDGKLDVEGFKASVDTEVSEWEDTSSSVQGIGTITDTDPNATSVKTSDDMASHLLSLVN